MYQIVFETYEGELFTIHSQNYPLPRIGDRVKYETDDYIVRSVKHYFAHILGDVESTVIVITLVSDNEWCMPVSELLRPTDFASSIEEHCPA